MSILRQSRTWAFLCFVAIFLMGTGPQGLCACAGAPLASQAKAHHSAPARPCCPSCTEPQAQSETPCLTHERVQAEPSSEHGAEASETTGSSYVSPCSCSHSDSPSLVLGPPSPQAAPDAWDIAPARPELQAPATTMRREFVVRSHGPPQAYAPRALGSRAPPTMQLLQGLPWIATVTSALAG